MELRLVAAPNTQDKAYNLHLKRIFQEIWGRKLYIPFADVWFRDLCQFIYRPIILFDATGIIACATFYVTKAKKKFKRRILQSLAL